MKINISNFEKKNKNLFDLSIIQADIGGGTTSKEQIDTIQEYPDAKSLIISGLNFRQLLHKQVQIAFSPIACRIQALGRPYCPYPKNA